MAHLAARALSPAEQDHAGDLSVDHPAFVESYRAAYAIKTRDGDGRATTLCPEPGGTHLAEVEGGSMVDASIPARLALFCSPTTSGEARPLSRCWRRLLLRRDRVAKG